MPRPAREPNRQLQMLIEEAGFSHKGLARRVNDFGRAKGIQNLSYDHSSVIRWLKGETSPRSRPIADRGSIVDEPGTQNYSG